MKHQRLINIMAMLFAASVVSFTIVHILIGTDVSIHPTNGDN
jgi:hypothetical protein